ncbi:uncharacterized protein N7483_011241 [Penicillium malachiteum]|uniref:uncharacterized protein n=1 Tax=Penicillium malachiteum TaxID=1324776 RepID=UPI0025485A72|nr:uncharacterized protein N7483_011241 [Penicillium malachiteum]KAJ5714060.1 hypothetical protein N7483_011241 [Penicillium malachiteum]
MFKCSLTLENPSHLWQSLRELQAEAIHLEAIFKWAIDPPTKPTKPTNTSNNKIPKTTKMLNRRDRIYKIIRGNKPQILPTYMSRIEDLSTGMKNTMVIKMKKRMVRFNKTIKTINNNKKKESECRDNKIDKKSARTHQDHTLVVFVLSKTNNKDRISTGRIIVHKEIDRRLPINRPHNAQCAKGLQIYLHEVKALQPPSHQLQADGRPEPVMPL